MFRIKEIKTIKIKKLLGDLPDFLAEKSFLIFSLLFIFFLILSGLVFFKYITLANNQRPTMSEKPLAFESKMYENILQIWQDRKMQIENSDTKEYPNLFSRLPK